MSGCVRSLAGRGQDQFRDGAEAGLSGGGEEKLAGYKRPLNPHAFLGMGGRNDIMSGGREAVQRKVGELMQICGSAGEGNNMISRQQYKEAVTRAAAMLQQAGIVITPEEQARFEVADFGLGELEKTGLEIITYVNTERCCAKEIIMFPGQTCPEHWHPTVAGQPGKEETFRCRWGTVYLYIPGPAAASPACKPPAGSEAHYTGRHEGLSQAGRPVHAHAGHAALVSSRPRRRHRLRVFHAQHRRKRRIHRSTNRKIARCGVTLKLNAYLVKSTVVAALGGLLLGFDTAVIAGATRDLSRIYDLSPAMLGVTVSSALWGTILGAAFSGIPGDRWGRRDSLRAMAVLYFVSALGCAFAGNWSFLVFFRFVAGIAIGGSSVLGPMYIAEISPAQWRDGS